MFKVLKSMFRFFLPRNEIVIVKVDNFYYIKKGGRYLDDYRLRSESYFDQWWPKSAMDQGKFASLELAEARLSYYIKVKYNVSITNGEELVKSVNVSD